MEGWNDGGYETNAGFQDAIQQAKNLANHPIVKRHVCLMPDFHVGYGMPIGGVIGTQGGVIPNAVGVDIGCGMIAGRTTLEARYLSKDLLGKLRLEIHKRIPVGMTHHEKAQNHPYLDKAKLVGEGILDDAVIAREFEKADKQIGTLGGGNHFIEIQEDQNGEVWIMIHSGSRNLGKQVCDHYHKIAKDYMEKFHSDIPDMDLAFLPEGTKEYNDYLRAMNFCLKFAEHSRALMLERVLDAFREVGMSTALQFNIDTHHNFARMENHSGSNYLVHRKGAVEARGHVTIPGSMGTASYICKGLENPESFSSCSHGAGRVMGRKEANRAITHEQALDMMKDVVFGIKNGDYDEMPVAYKDIHKVIEWQKDLVEPVYTLKPLAVCKG